MIERLFVYGSLAPGECNHDVMAGIQGEWQPGEIRGQLINPNWREAGWYPSFVIDDNAAWVKGQVFSSSCLSDHWSRLDAFEGERYLRSQTLANIYGDKLVQVFVYTLNPESPGIQ